MPTKQIHVRDHDRRKPHQHEEIHVTDYERRQDLSFGPAAGASELGPMVHGEPACPVCGEPGTVWDSETKLWRCEKHSRSSLRMITAIDIARNGHVTIGYPDGRWHEWHNVKQAEVVDAIRKNGADVIVGNDDGSTYRYNVTAALRIKDYLEDLERKTGKKIVFEPTVWVGNEEGYYFKSLEEARGDVSRVRPSFDRLGVKPIIVQQTNGWVEYPTKPVYIYYIASDTTKTWKCWDKVFPAEA